MRNSGFKIGLIASAFLHVLGIIAIIYASSLPPSIDLNQKVVTVQLAKLGKPRDEKLMPRLDASEVVTPSLPEPVKEKKEVKETKKAKESTPTKPLKSAKAKHQDKHVEHQPSALDVLKKRFGKPSDEGSLKGSSIGSSLNSELAETYEARVVEIIRAHYVLPETLKRVRIHLLPQISLKIGARGEVLSVKLISSSKNTLLDRSVMLVFDRIQSFGPPPVSLRKRYASEGLNFEFDPR